MHPLIQEQIKTVERHLAELQKSLHQQRGAMEKRDADHEELQREQWRQRKHQVTISHMAEDLETTQRKLELYQTERTDIHASLDGLLTALKALRASAAGEEA